MSNRSVTGLRNGVIDLIAGALGGTALVYVGQPFDTIKVKMQTFPTLYKNMIHCFTQTLQKDGVVRGLYAGTVPSIIANVAENSVLFAGYGFCQRIIMSVSNAQDVQELSIFQNALAGSLAASAASLALCPTELIKCRLQAMREMALLEPKMNQERIGPLKLTQQIIKTEGFQGLFHGLGATIFREMLGYFFFFGGYEATRKLLRDPNQEKEDIGMLKTMAAGGAGGVFFWVVIFPADVVKSRLQITNAKISASKLTVEIFKKEGVLALYNGLLPSIVRTIPAAGTLFVVVEYSKKFMHSFFE